MFAFSDVVIFSVQLYQTNLSRYIPTSVYLLLAYMQELFAFCTTNF